MWPGRRPSAAPACRPLRATGGAEAALSLERTTIWQRPAELLQELIRFDTTNPPGNEAPCIAHVDGLLRGAGIETTILRLPFCVAPPELWPQVANALQGSLHHQQYERRSLELATDL